MFSLTFLQNFCSEALPAVENTSDNNQFHHSVLPFLSITLVFAFVFSSHDKFIKKSALLPRPCVGQRGRTWWDGGGSALYHKRRGTISKMRCLIQAKFSCRFYRSKGRVALCPRPRGDRNPPPRRLQSRLVRASSGAWQGSAASAGLPLALPDVSDRSNLRLESLGCADFTFREIFFMSFRHEKTKIKVGKL